MTAPALDPRTMKRLAFIRLLHQQGVDQTRLPEPLNFTSVLSFHDAVEHFLILAGEYLGAELPDRMNFKQYWTELPKKLGNGVELSGKVGMDRLNRLRNSFKHVGTPPGAAAIEQARADVAAFFEENTPRVFRIPFGGIDMTDLIHQPEAREMVKAAQASNAGNERGEAMTLLVDAFDSLSVRHINAHGFRRTPFRLGSRAYLGPMRKSDLESALRQLHGEPDRMLPSGPQRLAEQIDWLTEIASEAHISLRLIALGIDLRQYHRFLQLTPEVYHYDRERRRCLPGHDYAPTAADFDFCHQFVITVALRIAELESHPTPPSLEHQDQDAPAPRRAG